MALTRTTVTDDSGAGTDGTVANNAWFQTVWDTIDARWSRTTTTSTGTQTVINPSEADLLICNNATDLTIRSLTAPSSPAKPAKKLVIISTGAGNVFINHQDTTGTTAANRVICLATSGPAPLAAGVGCAVCVYDDNASRWRLIAHEQGAWLTATYSGGNFTGNGSMTWTVDSGDITTMAYRLQGRTLIVSWYVATTTVGGTPSSQLIISNGAWGSFTAAKTVLSVVLANDNGAGNTQVFAQVSGAAGTTIIVQKNSGNWTAATNATAIFGAITFEVN